MKRLWILLAGVWLMAGGMPPLEEVGKISGGVIQPAIVVAQKAIYLFGGYTAESVQRYKKEKRRLEEEAKEEGTLPQPERLPLMIAVRSAYRYTPGGGWSRLAPMPYAQAKSCALATEQSIYLIGGVSYWKVLVWGNYVASRSFFEYDIQRNRWKRLALLPPDLFPVQCFLLQGGIFVVGSRFPFPQEPEPSLLLYYPFSTRRWERVNPPHQFLLARSPVFYALGGKLYAYGIFPAQSSVDENIPRRGEVRLIQDKNQWHLEVVPESLRYSFLPFPSMEYTDEVASSGQELLYFPSVSMFKGFPGTIFRVNPESGEYYPLEVFPFTRMPHRGYRWAYSDGNLYFTADGKLYKYRVENAPWKRAMGLSEGRLFPAAGEENQKVLVAGGEVDGKPTPNTFLLDLTSRSIESLPPLQHPRYAATAVWYQGKWFVIGGINQGVLRSVEVYTSQTNRWEFLPSLLMPRSFHCSVVTNERIYAFGGAHQGALDSAEVYDGKVWFELPPMPKKLYGHACANTDRNKIMIAGGISETGEVSSSVFLFDTQTLTYAELPPMNEKRAYFSLALFPPQILTIGGWNGERSLDTYESYDAVENLWKMRGAINIPRYGMASFTDEQHIYFLGGFGIPFGFLPFIDSFTP